MGYTHYWQRKKVLDPKTFAKFAQDAAAILEYSQNILGIALADGLGKPQTQPEANTKRIWFNGTMQIPGQWTTTENISIPWPSPNAGLKPLPDVKAPAIDGVWCGGHMISRRVAPIRKDGFGDGEYETFHIDQHYKPYGEWDVPDAEGWQGGFCKTAYRPYDLPVTAVLIAFKKHFGPHVRVSSDGELKDWAEGARLCHEVLRYAGEIDFEGDGNLIYTERKEVTA